MPCRSRTFSEQCRRTVPTCLIFPHLFGWFATLYGARKHSLCSSRGLKQTSDLIGVCHGTLPYVVSSYPQDSFFSHWKNSLLTSFHENTVEITMRFFTAVAFLAASTSAFTSLAPRRVAQNNAVAGFAQSES